MTEKIPIIGASSGIGLESVKAALVAGYQVRAFARSAAQIPLDHENLEKFPGDALKEQDIESALADISVVIQTGQPHNAHRPD